MKGRCAGLWLLAAACGSEQSVPCTQAAVSTQAVVYADDTRLEVADHADPSWTEVTDHSVAAVVTRRALEADETGAVQLTGADQQTRFGLCDGERFNQQLAVAGCSAVLIAPNLALSAAHCVNPRNCRDVALVFGYREQADGSLRPLQRERDVFHCVEVIAYELSEPSDDPQLDYAVFRLDRAFVCGLPVRARPEPPVAGESVVVLSTPLGVPIKVDDGGAVMDARSGRLDYFTASTDTFAGSSGGPVFDRDARLLGYVLSGDRDFSANREQHCDRIARLTEQDTAGERIARVWPALQAACTFEPDAEFCSVTRDTCAL